MDGRCGKDAERFIAPTWHGSVYYGEEGFLHRNGGRAGRGHKRSSSQFASLNAAKSAPFPDGCTFAYIPVHDGSWVHHSPKFGWEFLRGGGG